MIPPEKREIIEFRQESDYVELNESDKDDASDLIQDAIIFVNQLKRYIEESLFP